MEYSFSHHFQHRPRVITPQTDFMSNILEIPSSFNYFRGEINQDWEDGRKWHGEEELGEFALSMIRSSRS